MAETRTTRRQNLVPGGQGYIKETKFKTDLKTRTADLATTRIPRQQLTLTAKGYAKVLLEETYFELLGLDVLILIGSYAAQMDTAQAKRLVLRGLIYRPIYKITRYTEDFKQVIDSGKTLDLRSCPNVRKSAIRVYKLGDPREWCRRFPEIRKHILIPAVKDYYHKYTTAKHIATFNFTPRSGAIPHNNKLDTIQQRIAKVKRHADRLGHKKSSALFSLCNHFLFLSLTNIDT